MLRIKNGVQIGQEHCTTFIASGWLMPLACLFLFVQLERLTIKYLGDKGFKGAPPSKGCMTPPLFVPYMYRIHSAADATLDACVPCRLVAQAMALTLCMCI